MGILTGSILAALIGYAVTAAASRKTCAASIASADRVKG